MYQLYLGLALYEAEQQRGREMQAQREHRRPDEVEIIRPRSSSTPRATRWSAPPGWVPRCGARTTTSGASSRYGTLAWGALARCAFFATAPSGVKPNAWYSLAAPKEDG